MLQWVRKQTRYRCIRYLYVGKYHSLKWIPFMEDKPIYLQFCQFLHCKPSLFILHKPHSLNHCLYGFIFLFILSRVLYICLTFNTTRNCCGSDRMGLGFSANNSIRHNNRLFLYNQSLVALLLAMGLSLPR